MRRRRGSTRRRWAVATFEAAIALIILAVILFPVVWLALISVRSVREIYQYPLTWLPQQFTLSAYRDVWISKGYSTDWLRYFFNTLGVSACVGLAATLFGTLIGYTLSRMREPVVGRIQLFMIIVQLFEGPALVVPVYTALNRLGLYNSLIGYALLLVVFFVPLATLLGIGFARSVPVEIDEAARIDGCSSWQVFRLTFLPLARVGLLTAGLMTFLLAWGEFPYASVLLKGSNRTVSTALVDLISGLSVYWNNLAAASVIISIPVILILVLAQKHIIAGLTAGSGK